MSQDGANLGELELTNLRDPVANFGLSQASLGSQLIERQVYASVKQLPPEFVQRFVVANLGQCLGRGPRDQDHLLGQFGVGLQIEFGAVHDRQQAVPRDHEGFAVGNT